MKKLAMVLGMVTALIGGQAWAWKTGTFTFSGGYALPTGYTIGSESLLLSAIPKATSHLQIYNGTGSAVACEPTWAKTAVAPANTSNTQVYIPNGVGLTFDFIGVSQQIYCRSNSGSSITSGTLFIHTW